MLRNIIAFRNMQTEHLDTETAFLHGEIGEELYMEQPPWFTDETNKHLVCKLQRGL